MRYWRPPSYPTFDLADYYDKYEQLATNRRRPLWSRFALGTYAPGSTFKPMMAVASLEEGAITPQYHLQLRRSVSLL